MKCLSVLGCWSFSLRYPSREKLKTPLESIAFISCLQSTCQLAIRQEIGTRKTRFGVVQFMSVLTSQFWLHRFSYIFFSCMCSIGCRYRLISAFPTPLELCLVCICLLSAKMMTELHCFKKCNRNSGWFYIIFCLKFLADCYILIYSHCQ
jgi:hypothetical protein